MGAQLEPTEPLSGTEMPRVIVPDPDAELPEPPELHAAARVASPARKRAASAVRVTPRRGRADSRELLVTNLNRLWGRIATPSLG
jgi:hypothetical protein